LPANLRAHSGIPIRGMNLNPYQTLSVTHPLLEEGARAARSMYNLSVPTQPSVYAMTSTARDLLTIPEDLAARHRLSMADYHKMGEAGMMPKESRVELTEGDLIDMPPIGSRHALMVNRLVHATSSALHKKAIITV
jgi:hypothetical protein